mgnify:CR=1 FL=1
MSDMKIAVWLRRESCAYMVVNASARSLSIASSIKFLETTSFSSIIRSGSLESFRLEHCPEKGAKCSVYSITITQKHSPAKHFFRYTKPPERTGAYSSASCAVTWRCSTEVENTICVRVRPKCCSSPINWSSSMVLTKRPSMSME